MSSSKDRNNNFTFDIGDVEITVSVDGEEILGKVCADALALASPVWKMFVYPPWNNSAEEESTAFSGRRIPTAKVNFSTDNSDALLVLLRIVHFQFDSIPAILTRDELFEIAVLADQYNCHKLLQPWIGNWLEVHNDPWEEAVDKELSLFVFWVFGNRARFEKAAKSLVKVAKLSNAGGYLSASGERFPEPSPPGIQENILASRLVTIEALLAIPYHAMDHLSNILNTTSSPTTESARVEQRSDCLEHECNKLLCSCLQRSMEKKQLWPRKQPQEIRASVARLGTDIATLSFLPDNLYATYFKARSHPICIRSFDFQRQVKRVWAIIKSPVGDAHLEHIAIQNGSER